MADPFVHKMDAQPITHFTRKGRNGAVVMKTHAPANMKGYSSNEKESILARKSA
jgi:hypothetical protein